MPKMLPPTSPPPPPPALPPIQRTDPAVQEAGDTRSLSRRGRRGLLLTPGRDAGVLQRIGATRKILFGSLVVLFLISLAWGADNYWASLTATDTNQTVDLGFPSRRITVWNRGANEVFVNITGSGIAAVTGTANTRVDPGLLHSYTLPESGQQVRLVGLICSSGESTTVEISAVR